jgi:hypothetical protein
MTVGTQGTPAEARGRVVSAARALIKSAQVLGGALVQGALIVGISAGRTLAVSAPCWCSPASRWLRYVRGSAYRHPYPQWQVARRTDPRRLCARTTSGAKPTHGSPNFVDMPPIAGAANTISAGDLHPFEGNE